MKMEKGKRSQEMKGLEERRRKKCGRHTTICNPDPTSLIARASRVYPRVEKYLNHRKTGGI